MTDSEHLQWIHDRIVNVYDESENVDFLIRMRNIIEHAKANENGLQEYVAKAVEEERENIRQWLIDEDFEGLAEQL